jgi:hypothetical protein
MRDAQRPPRREARFNAVKHGVTARTALPADFEAVMEALAADIAARETDPTILGYAREIARRRIAAHRAGLAIDALLAPFMKSVLEYDEVTPPAVEEDPMSSLARKIAYLRIAAHQAGLPMSDDLARILQGILDGTAGPPAVSQPRPALSRDAIAEVNRLNRYRRRALGEARTLERRLAALRWLRRGVSRSVKTASRR